MIYLRGCESLFCLEACKRSVLARIELYRLLSTELPAIRSVQSSMDKEYVEKQREH